MAKKGETRKREEYRESSLRKLGRCAGVGLCLWGAGKYVTTFGSQALDKKIKGMPCASKLVFNDTVGKGLKKCNIDYKAISKNHAEHYRDAGGYQTFGTALLLGCRRKKRYSL